MMSLVGWALHINFLWFGLYVNYNHLMVSCVDSLQY